MFNITVYRFFPNSKAFFSFSPHTMDMENLHKCGMSIALHRFQANVYFGLYRNKIGHDVACPNSSVAERHTSMFLANDV